MSLILSDRLRPIVPLLQLQPYIHQVTSLEAWQVQDTAPMTPRVPPVEPKSGQIFHLGYTGWPLKALPEETYETALHHAGVEWLKPLDLQRPWITVPGAAAPTLIAVGFTDEWFELKVGIVTLLDASHPLLVLAPAGSRWAAERPTGGYPFQDCGWLEAARIIRNADVFLGCCSALHVLSCAMGKPTIVVEPNEHRWHPIFHPEAVRDRVHLVLGTDGRPTFDARHVRDAIAKFT